MRSHTEVAEERDETKKDERNGYPIAVAVNDGLFATSVAFPKTTLKIDAQRVRWDLAQYLVSRELTSDENHDLKSEREFNRTESRC